MGIPTARRLALRLARVILGPQWEQNSRPDLSEYRQLFIFRFLAVPPTAQGWLRAPIAGDARRDGTVSRLGQPYYQANFESSRPHQRGWERRSAANCGIWAFASSRRDRAIMRKTRKPRRLLKKLSRPRGRDSRKRGSWQADRDLVSRRSSDRAENKVTRRWAKRGTRPAAPHAIRGRVRAYIIGASGRPKEIAPSSYDRLATAKQWRLRLTKSRACCRARARAILRS